MSSKKLPAIQFYPGDWRKDPGVQALDYEHRGVWFEMLLLMHESDQRGKLLLNGKAMPDEALARFLGLDLQKIKKIKSTLVDYGVASIDPESGTLYCRRMVGDEKLRQKRAKGGEKGAKHGYKGGRPPKNPSKTPSTKEEGVSKKPLQNPPSVSTSSSPSGNNSLSPPVRARVNEDSSEQSDIPNHMVPVSADPPPEEDVIEFFENNGGDKAGAAEFYNYYHSQGWLKRNQMPVTSWRHAAKGWIEKDLHDPPGWKKKNNNKNQGGHRGESRLDAYARTVEEQLE